MIGNLIHFKKSKVQNFYPVFAIILLIIYDFLHTMFCSCFFALTPLLHAKFKENFFLYGEKRIYQYLVLSCNLYTSSLSYSRIIVLENGSIREFDSPQNLLANHSSVFFSMAYDAQIVR